MSCQGSGRYIILRATTATAWEMFEIFAFANLPLLISPTAVTLSGMTASPGNYDSLLFGGTYVEDDNYITL